MTCYSDFKELCSNLRMSDIVVDNVRKRYKNITKRVNIEYWNTSSEADHSFYVGSYGRGTAIYTSDIDIVVILPNEIYNKYDNYRWNGQSALLQDLKNVLKKEYPNSNIKGDGQVVGIDFSDNISFEIVPAFKLSNHSSVLTYPDTHDNGSWKKMDPIREKLLFNIVNSLSNGNLKKFSRMLRAWNANNNVFLSGSFIDFMLYSFFDLKESDYFNESEIYFDLLSKDVFQYANKNWDTSFSSPSNYYSVKANYPYSYQDDSQEAFDIAKLACKETEGSSKWYNYWRKIYGSRFPNNS